ncbi:MAG: peptidylprolyl isomerase [Ruminococcus sp.]|nr:peptidylprolyl isomerase [Ruminococcus sp.]
MIKKKLLALILCGITASALMTSCGQKVDFTTDPSAGDTELSGENSESPETPTQAPENVDIMNFTPPEKGDKVIELTFKDYGTVKFRLFPEYADLGVENFIGLAEDGFYDGLTFHRIIKDFMIQGGDPLGNGTGGKSLWGSTFDGGTDPHLIHLSGAVAYANSSTTASNTSQFYIVTGEEINDETFEMYSSYGEYSFSDKAKEAYKQNGGIPYLDGNYTVFGQVFDGLDIIYQIQCKATDTNDKPLDDVIIESVKVTEYNGEELKWNISDYDFDDPTTHEVDNFTPPEIDDEIVVMNIKDYGEVKIRVFPELIPQGSENFIELARQGYYDGLTFHRVIKDFMIQGGDPNGNGTGGASIWGEKFDGGKYFNLIHAAGAVAYANSGATSTNGSQFYIVTGKVYGKESLEGLTESAKEVYSTVGGTPYLDGNYTVFGQVIDGLDIIFKIQNVETDTTNDKPVEDVVIESMTVEKYDGSDIHWYISDTNDTDDTTESNTDSEETTEEETAE